MEIRVKLADELASAALLREERALTPDRARACCVKCACLVTASPSGLATETADARLRRNLATHVNSRRCRGRQRDPWFWRNWERDAVLAEDLGVPGGHEH